MKFLHTSDWHVGKLIRGHSRIPEHAAVLSEMADIAARSEVDLSIVAGDLFETAAPSPDAERTAFEGLLALAEVSPVMVIAGNHDHPGRLEALAPLLKLGRVTVVARPVAPADGGVVETELGGVPVRVAMLPFVSQRGVVRADQLMSDAGFEHAQAYAERMAKVVERLTEGFGADSVNVVVAHAFVAGGTVGGGERPAHLADAYAISAQSFPVTASYVALGHLHRAQSIRGATAIHYCGSPLVLDFGESAEPKSVNVVTCEPGLPARVDPVPLRAGRPLHTLLGSVDDVVARAEELGPDTWLRIRLREAPRVGLAEEVRERIGPHAVDVGLEHIETTTRRRRRPIEGRAPGELFADYLEEMGDEDPAITQEFDRLLDDVTGAAS